MAGHWIGRTKVSLRFDEHCRAAGTISGKFNNCLGTLARRANILPPTKSYWIKVLPSVKNDGWNNILVYTNLKMM